MGAGGPGSIPGEALFGLFISIRDVNNWNHTTENNERNCVKQIDCTKAYVVIKSKNNNHGKGNIFYVWLCGFNCIVLEVYLIVSPLPLNILFVAH